MNAFKSVDGIEDQSSTTEVDTSKQKRYEEQTKTDKTEHEKNDFINFKVKMFNRNVKPSDSKLLSLIGLTC